MTFLVAEAYGEKDSGLEEAIDLQDWWKIWVGGILILTQIWVRQSGALGPLQVEVQEWF